MHTPTPFYRFLPAIWGVPVTGDALFRLEKSSTKQALLRGTGSFPPLQGPYRLTQCWMQRGVNQQRADAAQQQPPVARQGDADWPRWSLAVRMTDHPRRSHTLREHGRSECPCDHEDGLHVGRDHLVLPMRLHLMRSARQVSQMSLRCLWAALLDCASETTRAERDVAQPASASLTRRLSSPSRR